MTHPENWTAKSKTERDQEIVQRLINNSDEDKALEIAKERGTLVWVADDGNADIEFPNCTRNEAAKEYVADGDYGTEGGWVTVYTWARYYVGNLAINDTNRDSHTVEIEVEEPECTASRHDWKSPIEIVGGIKENPGVWGKGGGVIINQCCMNCACQKTTDTWAQNMETGEQGLTLVSYEEDRYAEELKEYYEQLNKYELA